MTMSTSAVVPENVLKVANTLRPDGPNASFTFGTGTYPFGGKQCLVYAVGFPEACWAVRVPIHALHAGAEAVSADVEHEASVLSALEAGGYRWSPRLISFDSTFDGPIRFPYIVSSWVPGVPLKWNDLAPDRELRDRVLGQMAPVMTDLAVATHALGQKNPSRFLTEVVDRKIGRVLRGQARDFDLGGYLYQRAVVSRVFSSLDDHTTTVIPHEDLDPANIIIDGEHNITGIIDWGSARRIPTELAIALPRFLAIEMWSPTGGAVVSSSGVDFQSRFLQPSPLRSEDRTYLVESLGLIAAENKKITGPKAATGVSYATLALQVLSITSNPKVDWKRLLFESVFSRGTYMWMAGHCWLLRGIRESPDIISPGMLSAQWLLPAEIDTFLSHRPDTLGHGHEQRLRDLVSDGI